MQNQPNILNVSEWVSKFQYKNKDISISFIPEKYFITSGDAIQKTIKMRDDLKTIDETMEFYSKKSPYPKQDQVLKIAEQINALLEHLYEVRGDATFLEIEWNSEHQLLLLAKNPRTVVA